MARLLLIEGVCGAGKTTLGGLIARALTDCGESVAFFDEGAPNHPVSLNGYGFLRPDDFAALCARFPQAACAMRRHAIQGDGYMLVPYRDELEIAQNAELAACLRAQEICWTDAPCAPLARHCDARVRQWERFARTALTQERLFLMEGVFLQHPIHDLSRLYGAGDSEIGEYVRRVAEVSRRFARSCCTYRQTISRRISAGSPRYGQSRIICWTSASGVWKCGSGLRRRCLRRCHFRPKRLHTRRRIGRT